MKTLLYTLLSLLMLPVFGNDLQAQENLLGKVSFPNSGDETAQSDFIEGVKFLHNFEYADAARAFRRAQDQDPDFALAYYGEAKTYNHPIWMEQDREAAMEVLNRLGDTVEERQSKASTQREKDYLMTLEVLYGNTPESQGKTKEERDDLYMEAMKKLHEKYPDDHEANAFYGLSILGTAHEGRDFKIYMKAAAELFDVWNENKEHPGAAHYLIHSFDDPIHAPLGLPMAKAYSEIAPAAAHAQHMTSHIFLALGMWDEVVEANVTARNVQTNRQKELDEETTVCGHYPWWLQYGYLQEGQVEEAKQVLNTCQDRINNDPSSRELWHFAVMRAHQLVDTRNWNEASTWTASYDPETNGARNYFFASALSAIKTGNMSKAEEHFRQLVETPGDEEKDIQIKQLKGLMLIEQGNTSEGLKTLREAVADESELPLDFGPPTIVKPSNELLGDVLLKLDQYEKAIQAYEKQLERTPKRRLSLMGKERAMGMALK